MKNHIDVKTFLKNIVCEYKDIKNPEAYLEWVALVALRILDQMDFKNVTNRIQ